MTFKGFCQEHSLQKPYFLQEFPWTEATYRSPLVTFLPSSTLKSTSINTL